MLILKTFIIYIYCFRNRCWWWEACVRFQKFGRKQCWFFRNCDSTPNLSLSYDSQRHKHPNISCLAVLHLFDEEQVVILSQITSPSTTTTMERTSWRRISPASMHFQDPLWCGKYKEDTSREEQEGLGHLWKIF